MDDPAAPPRRSWAGSFQAQGMMIGGAERVLLARNGATHVWGLQDMGRTSFAVAARADDVVVEDVTRDERLLATGFHGGAIVVYSIATGHPVAQWVDRTEPIAALALAADGRQLLVARPASGIEVRSLATTASAKPVGAELLSASAGSLAALVWGGQVGGGNVAGPESPRGCIAALYEMKDGRELRLWKGTQDAAPRRVVLSGATSCMAVTRDGGQVCLGDSEGGLAFVDTASGTVRRRAGVLAGGVAEVAYSADGRRVAVGGGASAKALGVVPVAADEPVDQFPPLAAPISSMCFGPTDRWVIAGCASGEVVFLDRLAGREVVKLPPEGRTLADVRWLSQAGALLVVATNRVDVEQLSLPVQEDAIRANLQDLRNLGRWYVQHGLDDWACEAWEKARRQGLPVDQVALAEAYWRAGDTVHAAVEFAGARASNDSVYLRLCHSAVAADRLDQKIETPAATRPFGP